jgi:hypothetical protein
MDQDKSAAEWTMAYLEWIDAEPDFSREGVLLMALRTEVAEVHALADKLLALQLH